MLYVLKGFKIMFDAVKSFFSNFKWIKFKTKKWCSEGCVRHFCSN